jgi:predicted MFS family arabinose efflux permease
MVIGICLSIAGAGGIAGGLFAESLALMIVGQAVGGAGFGASFTAFLRLVVRLVEPHDYAGAVSSIYLLSYSAFGVPIVVEGLLVTSLGIEPTILGYAGIAALLALLSLRAQLQVRRT